MALWNHLVPDLVELSVQEREVDKLPHSKYPIDEDTENESTEASSSQSSIEQSMAKMGKSPHLRDEVGTLTEPTIA